MATHSYPKEKIKILLLEGIHPSAVREFKRGGYTNIHTHKKALPESELKAAVKDVHILGIRSKTQVNAGVIEGAKKLLAVGCFCIGTNQVDLEAANNAGIAVFNSPYSNTRSVAELVIAEMIVLLRRILPKHEAAHQGKWLKDASSSFEVRGKTLGIIGYGHIGSQVSVLGEALGLQVLYYDIEPKLPLGNAVGVQNLNELLKRSDIVTLHVPATDLTKNMIRSKQLQTMKKGSILLNLSRGSVVDLKAIRKSIESKHLGGFGVDVYPSEPKSKGDPFVSELQQLPNVLMTPHIGGSTIEAQANIGVDAATKLINFTDTGSSIGSFSIPPLNLPPHVGTHRLLHMHKNVPGVLSDINGILSDFNANISAQYLNTNKSIGYVVFDIDRKNTKAINKALKAVPHTIRSRSLY